MSEPRERSVRTTRVVAIVAAITGLAALALSASVWLSADRLGVEGRVARLEGEAGSNRETLKRIQDDVRDIRQFLLGDAQPKRHGG